MPSIEIVCSGQLSPTDFWYLPFAVEAETGLLSHRTPSALFQADFDQEQGCFYHLGGPCLRFPPVRKRHAYTAADLCEEWWETIRFKQRYVVWINHLFKKLLDASPEGRLWFTSDYQFGPNVRRFKQPLILNQFWRRHDEGRLRTNALFMLANDQGTTE